MIRTGVVIEAKDGEITLLFDRPEACEKCGQCSGRQHNATLTLPGEARVGDQVDVDLPSGRLAQASLLAYVLPLAFLLLGLLGAAPLYRVLSLTLSPDLFTGLLALLGLALGLLLMWGIGRRSGTEAHFTPKVVAVHRADEDPASLP